MAGLADRTVSVRSAAGQAVDAWCQAGKSVLEGSDSTLTNLMDFPLCIPCLSICILYMPCLSMMLMYVDVDIIGLDFLVFLQTHSIH